MRHLDCVRERELRHPFRRSPEFQAAGDRRRILSNYFPRGSKHEQAMDRQMISVETKIAQRLTEHVTVSVGQIRQSIDPIRPGSQKWNTSERGRIPWLRSPKELAIAGVERSSVVAKRRIDGNGICAVLDANHRFPVCHRIQ